jgi:hypothetical protein
MAEYYRQLLDAIHGAFVRRYFCLPASRRIRSLGALGLLSYSCPARYAGQNLTGIFLFLTSVLISSF